MIKDISFDLRKGEILGVAGVAAADRRSYARQ
jgi:ABC-type sugar transport system ATPase subunit